MFYFISGNLAEKKEKFCVVETGGVGYKIFISEINKKKLPLKNSSVKLFCHLHTGENYSDLYGFLSEEELFFFEKLITISGVGPKSAIGILNIAEISQLTAAIKEGKAELLTKASGIGRKTAERIILELKDKIDNIFSAEIIEKIEKDLDIEEILVSLGYTKKQAKETIKKINPKTTIFEERLKEALKNAKR